MITVENALLMVVVLIIIILGYMYMTKENFDTDAFDVAPAFFYWRSVKDEPIDKQERCVACVRDYSTVC